MKIKTIVTISYEKEIDSTWYSEEELTKEQAIFLNQEEMNTDEALDVILGDFERTHYTVSVNEKS